ncbi:MAG: 3-deoxy-manno-octulosonate cytidylyltransferase [Flavobacteriaceae bacterium]
MKVVALIPARYDAQRFPGKLMQPLGNSTVIGQTYEAALEAKLFDKVVVVTNSEQIANHLQELEGNVLLRKEDHACGSDRIASVAHEFEADIFVNIQGDEPFLDTQSLTALLAVFQNDPNNEIALASLMNPIANPKDIENPNVVKVVVNMQNQAVYFSRFPIPFSRTNNPSQKYYKHRGVYAFRKKALVAFSQQAVTPLEAAEKIECLRFLEMGHRIQMIETQHEGIGIDTPEDLEEAQAIRSKK